MLLDNPVTRAAEKEFCRRDTLRHIEKHLVIKDKAGWTGPIGEHPEFKGLKHTQRKLLALIQHLRDQRIPARVIVLKARKTGISTLIEALAFIDVIEKEYDALVLAHDFDTAETIFQMAQRFYDYYELDKPETKRQNVRELVLQKPLEDSYTHAGQFKVITANNKQAGTGMTPQFMHCSEVAKWERGAETATALFQAIGDLPETTVVLESTAYGYDSLFQPYWENAERHCKLTFSTDKDGNYIPELKIRDADEWNGFVPFFISWFDDPDYEMHFETDEARDKFLQTLDDYEKGLTERFPQVTPEKLLWRRRTLASKCQGNLKTFQQEYPATPQEAFVATGRPRFSHEFLGAQPIEDGREVRLTRDDSWTQKLKPVLEDGSELIIYRNPVAGHRYVIGVDIAEGIIPEGRKDPDRSVATVLDIDDGGRQVAVLAGHIGEEYIVDPLMTLGEFYNWAYVCVEVSGYGQHVAIRLANEYPGERLYRPTTYKAGRQIQKNEIGFRTHVGTRNPLLSRLAQAFTDRAVIIHDRETVNECKKFVYKSSGRVEADVGAHDDYVFALALAVTAMAEYPSEMTSYSRVPADIYNRVYRQTDEAHATRPLHDGYM